MIQVFWERTPYWNSVIFQKTCIFVNCCDDRKSCSIYFLKCVVCFLKCMFIWDLSFAVVNFGTVVCCGVMLGYPEDTHRSCLWSAHICVPKYTVLYARIPQTSYDCIFRRQHQDSPVWRMTWCSQEQAQGAIQMMKMSVLQCLRVGQVITFSTFYMMVNRNQTKI
jgi:hypothetical protein